MANAPFLDRMKEDFLSCAICSEEFKRPKVLKCQHTFCEKCLKDYIIKTPDNEKKKKGFLCPICRVFIDAPDQTTPPSEWSSKINNNFVLDGIQDLLNSAEFQSEDSRRLISQNDNKLSSVEDEYFCEKHTKPLEYFCSEHQLILCYVCVVNEHRTCSKLLTCEEAALEGMFEVSELVKSTEINRRAADGILTEIHAQKECLNNDAEGIKEEIRLTARRLVTHINNLERDSLDRLEIILKRKRIEYDDQSFHCTNIISCAKETTENLHTMENHHPIRILRCIIERKREIKSEEAGLQETKLAFKGSNLVWFKDETLEQLCLGSTQLGNLEVNTFSVDIPYDVPVSTVYGNDSKSEDNFPQLKSTMYAGINSDRRYCWITGMTIMNDGKIALVDRRNKSIKLFNSSFQFINCIWVRASVFDVTTIGEDEIAVSLPKLKAVRYFQTILELEPSGELDTKQNCYGLAFGMEKLIVCCQGDKSSPTGVKLFNRNGTLFRHIFSDSEGAPLFTSLSYSYIAFCHRRSHISIIDRHSDHADIVVLLLNGEVKERMSFGSMKKYGHGLVFFKDSKLMANPENIVFTCSNKGHFEDFLQKKSVSYPSALAVNSTETLLMVSQVNPFYNCYANGIVKIFKLEH